ncbi:hypothetical protein HanIR_Chr03g0107881 [Helianthus annuus]|nr:hypothetical protein HanIR_Chr03g0107881 [Helianthus annuus]
MPCRTIGIKGACTGGAIVVGTWTVEFHVKHLLYENMILMLDFYINASATHLFMFGFENIFRIDE